MVEARGMLQALARPDPMRNDRDMATGVLPTAIGPSDERPG